MELRERVEKLSQPAEKKHNKYIKRIAFLEKQSEKWRHLRLLLCVHAVISVVLASINITTRPNLNTFIHIVLFINSLLAEACILFIYYIKARFSGITNASVGNHKRVNLFHSEHVWPMIVELIIWLLQCPPWVQRVSIVHALDCLVLLRLYVLVIAVSHYLASSIFSRSLGILCQYRSRTSNLLKAGFVQHHVLIGVMGALVVWVSLALLYMKCEEVTFHDALYFVICTAGLIGFGDVEPSTMPGRFIALLSFCAGLAIFAIAAGMMQTFLTMSDAERNLLSLFNVNSYIGKIPNEAARVIQRAWKLYSSKKEQRHALSIQFNALLLSHQASSFRQLRRAFAKAELCFLRSAALIEESEFVDKDSEVNVSGSSSLCTSVVSRSITPLSSPRSPGTRRPFAPLQQVKVKPSSTQSTPRLGPLQVTTFSNSNNSSSNNNSRKEKEKAISMSQSAARKDKSAIIGGNRGNNINNNTINITNANWNKSSESIKDAKTETFKLIHEATEVAERLVKMESNLDVMMRKVEHIAVVMNANSTELNS